MNWIQQFLWRRRMDRDLSEEIRQHLDEKVEDLVESGVAREEALRRARREFGNVTLIEEQGRDVWRWSWIEDFLLDVRFAFRQLRKSPAFATAGALTLALGIGANTAVFSVVNAVVLRPLPFAEPDRLVSVSPRGNSGPAGQYQVSYPNFLDFRHQNRVFDHLVSYRSTTFSLTGLGEPVELRGQIVSWDFLPLLGVQPILGRGFQPPDEDPGARTAIVSYTFWKTTLAGDPRAAGATISLNREPYLVVGVAPEGFNFPPGGEQVQIWTSLALDARSATVQPVTRQRGARMLSVLGRLRDGISIEQAQSQMDAVAASLVEQYPNQNRRYPGIYLQPGLEALVAPAREPLLFLFGAVGLLLLLACANMANLLLSRTAEREREFALRAAIGAARSRIIRQVIAESLTLSLLGSVGGVVLAAFLIHVAVPLAGTSIPRIDQAGVDRRVLLFALVLAAATCVLFSIAPAARLLRDQFQDPLKETGRAYIHGADRVRSALIVFQIALGLMLVSGAGLLTASYIHLAQRDPGFQPDRLLTFNLSLPEANYPQPRQLAFYGHLLEQLGSVPGATSAALAMPLPLTGSSMTVAFNIEQRPSPPHERPASNMAIVSPGFFQTAGIPLIQGRDFGEKDDADGPPVVIVNRAFAERFFPGESAVGKRIEPGATSDARGTRMREIVGVVGNARQSPLGSQADAIYYFPYQQLPWCCPSVVVRGAGSPEALESAARAVVSSMDKQLPLSAVRTGNRIFSLGIMAPRFLMLLLGSFAAIGLILAAVGLYGVFNYAVVKQTREIGVRIALGASRSRVLVMVLRRAMSLVATGIALGTAGSFAGSWLIRAMLHGVDPRNPVLLAAAISVTVATTLLATYLPARRAASVDPTLALRAE
jgi:predicted permease